MESKCAYVNVVCLLVIDLPHSYDMDADIHVDNVGPTFLHSVMTFLHAFRVVPLPEFFLKAASRLSQFWDQKKSVFALPIPWRYLCIRICTSVYHKKAERDQCRQQFCPLSWMNIRDTFRPHFGLLKSFSLLPIFVEFSRPFLFCIFLLLFSCFSLHGRLKLPCNQSYNKLGSVIWVLHCR